RERRGSEWLLKKGASQTVLALVIMEGVLCACEGDGPVASSSYIELHDPAFPRTREPVRRAWPCRPRRSRWGLGCRKAAVTPFRSRRRRCCSADGRPATSGSTTRTCRESTACSA